MIDVLKQAQKRHEDLMSLARTDGLAEEERQLLLAEARDAFSLLSNVELLKLCGATDSDGQKAFVLSRSSFLMLSFGVVVLCNLLLFVGYLVPAVLARPDTGGLGLLIAGSIVGIALAGVWSAMHLSITYGWSSRSSDGSAASASDLPRPLPASITLFCTAIVFGLLHLIVFTMTLAGVFGSSGG